MDVALFEEYGFINPFRNRFVAEYLSIFSNKFCDYVMITMSVQNCRD